MDFMVEDPSALNSTVETSVNYFLGYFLPVVTGITIPLVMTNLAVFLNTGILNSPSNLIYFNLVIMDLLNSVVGIMVSIDLAHINRNKLANPWHKEHLISSYIFDLAFDARIFLVLGLCIIKVLWTEMSALDVIKNLKMFSVATVVVSYVASILCFLIAFLFEKRDGTFKLFSSKFVEVMDVAESVLIITILIMSCYTKVMIRLNKSRINQSKYKLALKHSFLISLNFFFSYSYHIAHCTARFYFMKKWKNNLKCETVHGWKILVCDELYLGVSFMCTHSLVNSLILLWQVRHSWLTVLFYFGR